jgi:hypothetical protein
MYFVAISDAVRVDTIDERHCFIAIDKELFLNYDGQLTGNYSYVEMLRLFSRPGYPGLYALKEILCRAIHSCTYFELVGSRSDEFHGASFSEFIRSDFPEEVFGPQTCHKLFSDFLQHRDVFFSKCKEVEFRNTYDAWIEMFEVGRRKGFIFAIWKVRNNLIF